MLLHFSTAIHHSGFDFWCTPWLVLTAWGTPKVETTIDINMESAPPMNILTSTFSRRLCQVECLGLCCFTIHGIPHRHVAVCWQLSTWPWSIHHALRWPCPEWDAPHVKPMHRFMFFGVTASVWRICTALIYHHHANNVHHGAGDSHTHRVCVGPSAIEYVAGMYRLFDEAPMHVGIRLELMVLQKLFKGWWAEILVQPPKFPEKPNLTCIHTQLV